MTVINFNEAMKQAKTASFDPLPDDDYDVVCIESTPTESSTNKPMIKLRYQVESGPQVGKKIWNQQVFSADSDAALAIFFRYMAAHGLDETFFSGNPPWELVASSLVGRRVRLRLGHRTWQGQVRNEVKQVMPPSTPAAGITPQAAPAQPVQQQFPVQQPVAPVQQPAAVVPPVQQPAAAPPVAAQPASPASPATPIQQPPAVPQQPAEQLPFTPQQPIVEQPAQPVQQPVQQEVPVEQPQPQPAAEPAPVVTTETAPPPLPEVPF